MTTDADPQPVVGSVPEPDIGTPSPPPSKAGRNLRAAIAIGVGLGGIAAASLFIAKVAFVVFVVVVMMAAVRELGQAMRGRAVAIPEIPLVVGAGAVLIAAYVGGTEKLVVAILLLVVAAVGWGAVADGLDKRAGIAAGVFVACYVALLGGFAVLLVVPADGPRRVVA
ncbi:MAG: phosphatidate cytidylyltransferase, partial [Actinomycetota bacterium]|nr:phosphatidate cytidylyltransferase [Actinomycetota bacterium]